jgi:glycyl-tRNA synthetase alpha chain
MKPSPDDIVDRYMGSLDALGFDTSKNDVRLVEDDWEDQAAGASGVGWEVWVNGVEVSQFTFFQQMGGIECNPVSAEITYGPERLCLMLDGSQSFWEDLKWAPDLSYREAEWQLEMQHCVYNFEVASTEMLFKLFEMFEAESARILATPVRWDAEQGILTTDGFVPTGASEGPSCPIPARPGDARPPEGPLALVYPAFDFALKCSHAFNLLDARGAISVTERAAFIGRVRARVRACCVKHMEQYAVRA